jgi:hypothetical protein
MPGMQGDYHQPVSAAPRPIWMIAALVVLLALLMCATGGAAVRAGAVAPPELDLTVGGVGLVAKGTNVPSCTFWFAPCRVRSLGPGGQMYAVWVVWRPATSPREQPGALRLFAMHLSQP